MTILSAQSIRRRCVEHNPSLIEPFVERGVSPGGRSFGLSSASYDVRIDQDVIVPPHGFMLASTVERFNMHDDLAGTVRDKSTWARVGLAVQNTLLDPGWCGFLTVELSNHSDVEIRIAWGEPIAQIVFELLDQPTEEPYRGKYQHQERGPQPARRERFEAKLRAFIDHQRAHRKQRDIPDKAAIKKWLSRFSTAREERLPTLGDFMVAGLCVMMLGLRVFFMRTP